MIVPVMNIWIVRVRVFERLVNVGVRVWFLPIPLGPMLMLMMFIMEVRVCVFHADVAMQVLMVLGQMQPHSCNHEQPGHHQRDSQRRSE